MLMTLWCDGDSGGWDVCKWYRPNFGNASESDSCLYALNQGDCPQGPGFSHWSVSKRSSHCSLSVGPVQPNDVGEWKCLLLPKNSASGGKFQEITLERQDIRKPEINFDPGSDLVLQDGESHVFECRTSDIVNMEPSSAWVVGQVQYPGNVTLAQGAPDQGVSSWSMVTSLDYTASLSDSGRDIQCVVTLSDDLANLVTFSVSWSGLSVTPGPVQKAGFATWKILLIVLVPLLFILLLLILIASCWFFGVCCFSSGKKEKYDESDDPDNFYTTSMQAHVPSKSENPIPAKRKARNPAPYIDIDSLTPTIKSHPTPPLTLPWNPYSDIPDQLTHYDYQGDSSSAGSLSSLGSSLDEDRDLDMGDMLGKMGRKFRTLERLYREERSDEEQDGGQEQGDTVSYESWV